MNSKYHLSTTLSQNEVWEFFNTPDNRRHWVNGLLCSTPVKGKYQKKGDLLRVLFLINGAEIELREEIAEIIPGEILKLNFTSPGSNSVLTINVTAANFSTTVTLQLQVEWKGVRSLLLKTFWQPAIEKRMLATMGSLKNLLEADSVLSSSVNNANNIAL